MPWYKAGTVSVAQNSNAVTGTNTSFIANSRTGDAFLGPDGRWYEVTNIASDTAMAISPNYLGATAGAGTYALAPMQGYVKDSADALRALVNQFGTKLAALGTTGNYDILPLSKGGTGQSVASGAALIAALGLLPAAGGGYAPMFNSLRVLAGAQYGAGQGGYSGWNDANDGSGFSGQMAFTSNKGGGSGGFSWRSVNADNTVGGPTMTYSYDGILSVPLGIRLGGADIVAKGNNATGEWTRYADGTQICTYAFTTDTLNGAQVGALWGSNAYGAQAYPASFVSPPKVTATAVKTAANANGACFVSNYTPPTQTNWGNWRGMQTDGQPQTCQINLIAVGRWK